MYPENKNKIKIQRFYPHLNICADLITFAMNLILVL